MVLSMIVLFSVNSFAQDTPPTEQDYDDTWQTAVITDEMTVDADQHKSWRMGEYKFSAKPKNSWELGIGLGHYFIDGDVDREIPAGFGVGLHLRKALHYVFSIRGTVFYGQTKFLDPQPWYHRNSVSNGIGGGMVEPVFNAYDPNTGGPGHWFPAVKTDYMYCNMEGLLNIGNILFHKERNKWNWYLGLGIGLDYHKANLDLLDSNGQPYGSLISRLNWNRTDFDTKAGRDQYKSDLKDIYDGDYETEGFKKAGIFRVGDERNIHVLWTTSMGISRKLSKRINIGLEHQVMWSDNDYLDGIKFRTSLDQTNNVDIGHWTHLRIGINLGNFNKVTEPLYWLNPLDAAYSSLLELRQRPEIILDDDDEDGVINILDLEINSREGCPVDTRGIMLDSDGDGLIDCEDKEPYSRPDCPIDEFGVAQCEDCCTNEEEVNNLIEKKVTEIRREIIGGGRSSTGGGTTGSGETSTRYLSSECGDWFLPMIHFDLDKDMIKPEYYSHLHNVADVLTKCPSICVTAQGHTDSRNSNEYNRILSYSRAKNAVDYLVSNYQIDRSRIKLMYGGEEKPLITVPNSEAHHYMNRRVEFRTCNANDFDMLPPEGYSKKSAKQEYNKGNKSSGY